MFNLLTSPQFIVLTILSAIVGVVIVFNFSFGLGFFDQKFKGTGFWTRIAFMTAAFGGVISISIFLLSTKIWKAIVWFADEGFNLGTDLSLLL